MLELSSSGIGFLEAYELPRIIMLNPGPVEVSEEKFSALGLPSTS